MKGILFKQELAQRIFEGYKTQTRRYPKADFALGNGTSEYNMMEILDPDSGKKSFALFKGSDVFHVEPAYEIGEEIYVKEPFLQVGFWRPISGTDSWQFIGQHKNVSFDHTIKHRVSRDKDLPGVPAWYKRSSLFMPSNAARSIIKITDISMERICDISNTDAIHEGIPVTTSRWRDAKDRFKTLWESIHGENSFSRDWVFVYKFQKVNK